MGVGHRLADLLEDRQEPRQVVGRGRRARQQGGQGPALDQLHGEEGPAVGEGAQLVDRHDAGVLELAADLRLLDEPAEDLGVVAVLLQEDLDGQVAAQVGVAALSTAPMPPRAISPRSWYRPVPPARRASAGPSSAGSPRRTLGAGDRSMATVSQRLVGAMDSASGPVVSRVSLVRLLMDLPAGRCPRRRDAAPL